MSQVKRELASEIALKLAELMNQRGRAHCMLVSELSPDTAAEVGRILNDDYVEAPDRALVVTSEPTQLWECSPTKAVEFRNLSEEEGGRLLLIAPAGIHQAAEDSFGVSTFELISLVDAMQWLEDRLLTRLEVSDPEIAVVARDVLVALRSLGHDCGSSAGSVEFLAGLSGLEDPTAIGLHLPALGLLPDDDLTGSGELMAPRLSRNVNKSAIVAQSAPAAERVRQLLGDAAPAGSSDLARVLDRATGDVGAFITLAREQGVGGLVDFSKLDQGPIGCLESLSISRLDGDIALEDGVYRLGPQMSPKVGIRAVAFPALCNIEGAKEVVLELVRLGDTNDDPLPMGLSVSKKGKSLPKQSEFKMSLRLPRRDSQSLEEGAYRLRLTVFDEDNAVLGTEISDPFLVDQADLPALAWDTRAESARSVLHGLLILAEDSTAKDCGGTKWLARKGAGVVRLVADSASVPVEVNSSEILRKILMDSLRDSDAIGSYIWADGDYEAFGPGASAMPERFLAARRCLFESLLDSSRLLVECADPESPELDFAVVDLVRLTPQIVEYCAAWAEALDDAPTQEDVRALLLVDSLRFGDPGLDGVVLLAPVHPSRIGWYLEHQRAVMAAIQTGGLDNQSVEMLGQLSGDSSPFVIPGETASLSYAESVEYHWGAWADPSLTDAPALLARLRKFLGLSGSFSLAGRSQAIYRRVGQYLSSHPHVDRLVLNFVQPGSGSLVLAVLNSLQGNPLLAKMRYEIRLFSSEYPAESLGDELDAFMLDPESSPYMSRDSQDAFWSAQEDPLQPKLIYSKHGMDDLLGCPSDYEAHLTVIVDWFERAIEFTRPHPGRRSSFASGLVNAPSSHYIPGVEGQSPVWEQWVSYESGHVATDAAHAYEVAVMRLFGKAGDSELVPCMRMRLSIRAQNALDHFHTYSDWVAVVDALFDERFYDQYDSQADSLAPRYLLDVAGSREAQERVTVSTRHLEEVGRFASAVLDSAGLPVDEYSGSLISALQMLNPGLVLRSLGQGNADVESLGLAVAAEELFSSGVMRHALVVPVDCHQALLSANEGGDRNLRSDLVVIQLVPGEARLCASFVEVKCHRGGWSDSELLTHVSEQVGATQRAFASHLIGQPGRDTSAIIGLKRARLYALLDTYLDRAVRLGVMPASEESSARQLLVSLESEFRYFDQGIGVIVDFDAVKDAEYSRSNDIEVWKIGANRAHALLAGQAESLSTRFPGTGTPEVSLATVIGELGEGDSLGTAFLTAAVETPAMTEVTEVVAVAETQIEFPDLMLLGLNTASSKQFGLIGRQARSGRPVALDFDGTNVISVFGLQGAGKSYTVGSLIESATIAEPAMGHLPSPLMTVVFHYSKDMHYAPEYLSLVHPAASEEAIASLAEYGAAPRAVEDLILLTPADLVDERRAELPDVDVRPLLLTPGELSASDWSMLMGLEGGDQMYARAMNRLLRDLRGSLSIAALKTAIAESAMSAGQKQLALQRLQFAEPYVSEDSGIAELVTPGRVLIVDLRDELMQTDEALALALVLLNRIVSTDSAAGPVNKLLVFDEAHKYMNDSRLSGAIVEAIREMRHRGATVVVASQNPPSVPKEIVELSSVVIAHKFVAKGWLDHLAKANGAFCADNVKLSQLSQLAPGQAYVWAAGGSLDFRRPQLVKMRPRMTLHGGATKMAVDDGQA